MATQSSAPLPSILLFLLFPTLTGAVGSGSVDRISISCGSVSTSVSLNGREWLGDVYPKFSLSPVTVKGISSRTRVTREQPIVDPVPYGTARISSSRFSYDFWLNPGQKHIRLHFNPTTYKFGSGSFKRPVDYFSVDAGSFTLLQNFSASSTARALGLHVVTKEFCVSVHENVALSLVFTPAVSANPSQRFYAFVNGIEIISVPSGLSYCHDGDIGVKVVGQKSVVYIDSSTALEMAYRLNVKKNFVPSGIGGDDIGMFRMAAATVGDRANKVRYKSWNVSVDVGFRYLIRFHFCEMWLKIAAIGTKDFTILIDSMIAITNADVVERREGKGVLGYKNCMVMVNGNKQEGKRDILISLHSKEEFADGYGPLEGFEIFKLSNNDNSLASPNPLTPTGDSLSFTQNLLAVLGPVNSIAFVVIMLACLVNIIDHKFQWSWKGNSPDQEEIVPSTRAERLCRRFTLAEMKTATNNFNDAFVIGKGGFGRVYEGQIDNGKLIVAIKQLKPNSSQGKREFQVEIELLSEVSHVNVVSLVGYCCEKQEMILVYEYLPGGSLADHLFKSARKNDASSCLSWKQRLELCIGAGRGLEYLHTGLGIIHRDVKSSNILLDDNFVPKVSDFGLAKIHTGQSQDSTNFKGTFGYFDPDYFRTKRLTMKSDTYSFGVLLLEVLCGRPAAEPVPEVEDCSLTMWALDKISKGDVDQIIAPNLRDEISSASLNAFVRVVEKCLQDEPKKRPAMALVIINLQFALEQQEAANSLVPNEIAGVADALLFVHTAQPENANSFSPNEIEQVSGLSPQVKTESALAREVENGDDAMQFSVINNANDPTKQTTVGGTSQKLNISSVLKNITSPLENVVKTTMRKLQVNTESSLPKEVENGDNDKQFTVIFKKARDQKKPTEVGGTSHKARDLTTQTAVGGTSQKLKISSIMKNIASPLKNLVKITMRKLSRLWPWDAIQKSGKTSKKMESIGSRSAPVARRTINFAASAARKTVHFAAPATRKTVDMKSKDSTLVEDRNPAALVGNRTVDMKPKDSFLSEERKGPELLPAPVLKVYTIAELKAMTKNFRPDTILGEGGFGTVYKGFLRDKNNVSLVAVKKLNPGSMQGFQEWLSEVRFLGRLSHPNLVKLLGYCMEDGEHMLVYEFMPKGSLENHLFQRRFLDPLPWDIRLKILTEAATGLAYLHGLESKVIYRDLKASNILLDSSYNAKLSDFGLAKSGPNTSYSHISTDIMGTHGYAAPEYVATGHLYVASDVYCFGVVVVEMMTGLRSYDANRPPEQHNLVDWIKPLLSDKRKLGRVMDPRLEKTYAMMKSAFRLAQLAKKCLEPDPKSRPLSQEVVEVLGTVQSMQYKFQESRKRTGLERKPRGIERMNMSEVRFLGRLSHPNLVKLLGYCMEDGEHMLVYEFMPKGSLENRLFQRRGLYLDPLPWDTRLKILTEAATGLAYLHGLESKVIYRDLKASNILLDSSYNAKLSDFGLAKSGPNTSYSHISTDLMGTHGYAAPEYVATGHLYVASDVYCFGVVVVEMMTGLRSYDTNRPVEQHNLVDWIKPLLSNKRKLGRVMDPRLEKTYAMKSAFQLAQLAQKCLEPEPKSRPSSQEVVEVLGTIQSMQNKFQESRKRTELERKPRGIERRLGRPQ